MPPKPEKVPDKGPAKQAQSSQARKDPTAPKSQAPSGKNTGGAAAAASAAQPQSSRSGKVQPASTSQARSGKKSTATVGSAQAASANKDQSARNNERVLRSRPAKKPCGPVPSAGGAAPAASAAMARPISWEGLFKQEDELGKGHFGKVWKVKLRSSVPVAFALKQVEIFKKKTTLDEDRCMDLYRELANQRKCAQESPWVLPVIAWAVELYTHRRRSSLRLLSAMPLCRGAIKDFIKEGGIIGEFKPYVKLFTLHLSEAVAVVHGLGMVHADLHWGNVFIVEGPEGYRVVLADFGKSVDFSDPGQKAFATKRHLGSQWALQGRDLRGIGNIYLAMQHGNAGAVGSELGSYDEKLKRSERSFVLSMIASNGGKEPGVQAKDVKRLPFFNASNMRHPERGVYLDSNRQWALFRDAKIGDDVKRELGKLNIVWTDISADVLQNEIQEQLRAAKQKEMKSTSSK